MEKERFRPYASVLLLLERELDGKRQLLLQRRQNTGFMDGWWDCAASGHLEAGETMTAAIRREAREELGIAIAPGDLSFVTLLHRYTPGTGRVYLNVYFAARVYQGQPRIAEPDRCAALQWFEPTALPARLIEDRRLAIIHYLQDIPYGEVGWPAQSNQ